MKNRFFHIFPIICLAVIFIGLGAPDRIMAAEGPELGKPGQGAVIDKSADAELQKLIAEVLPKFKQLEFKDGDATLHYNLYIPASLEKGKQYPLVIFIADASTAGAATELPLAQGYGALVWATEEAQKLNPAYVLVPQFSGVAVNDAYEHTPEVEALPRLLKSLASQHQIDSKRLYATGQSMGGMIAMYLNTLRPRIFAASFFVDCHWNPAILDNLVENDFVFLAAGEKGKSWKYMKEIEEAARKMGRSYTWAEWSAKLPQAQQDELAATMLEKKQPINLISFETGSVLPESGLGSEHMYSFDYAYKLTPVRQWLFTHALEKSGMN